MFKKILVPLDGSRYSARALPYAIEIARCFEADVLLLEAVRPTPIIAPVESTGAGVIASPTTAQIIVEAAQEQDKRNVASAKRYLSRKLREMKKQGLEGSYQVVLGDPAKSIIAFCRGESVDLVIMTTSGKSGLKRTFLGSVADEVIREPGIPVLAIRPEADR